MSLRLAILAAMIALCSVARGGHLWLSVMDAAESSDDLDAIDGCIAYWSVLDSSDYVLSGVAVTNLTDKSGNGRTATLVGTSATIAAGAINGRDAINFANHSYFSFSEITQSNVTVVCVFQRPRAGRISTFVGGSEAAALPLWYTDNKIYVQYNGGYKYSAAIATTGRYWGVVSVGTNYMSAAMYLNSTNVSLPSADASGTINTTIKWLGRNGSAYEAGNIGALAIYGRVLTESDRATVDEIVKSKWGF